MRNQQLASATATLKAKATAGIPRIGNVALTDKTIYLNVAIKGQAGTVDIIDVQTKREVGITNLDGNKLNSGRDYVIDGVRVLVDSASKADIKTSTWVPANGTNLDPAFLNAEFRLKQEGNVLIDMPITDLSGEGDVQNLFRAISTSPLLRSNLEFEMEIEYPKGTTVDNAAAHNVRFEFRATQAKL